MLPADEYGWLNAGERGRTGDRRGKQTGHEDADGPGDGAGGGPGTGGPLEAGDASAAEGGAAAAAQFDPDAIPSADDPGVYRDETVAPGTAIDDPSPAGDRDGGQRAFFEYPGPLYRLEIRPAKARVTVNGECRLQATPRDKSRRTVDSDVEITWIVEHGSGHLDTESGEYVTYHAPEEPELAVVRAHARQDQVECEARATITVTAELGGAGAGSAGTGAVGRQGMPGYTYRYAPGELWRSRYEPDQSLVIVNSGHADFVYAARQSASKLRYVGRLFAKEIVLANFPGAPRDELLERMIELELYMDRGLR